MPAAPTHATAREIILEIVRNMRDGLEPLHYSALAPAIYNVYLHPDDLDRLHGILPRIVQEARQALDAQVAALNRRPRAGGRFRSSRIPTTMSSRAISSSTRNWRCRRSRSLARGR